MREVLPATRVPDADELLAARLARGWRPLPSPMRDGPEILGHARTRCRPVGDHAVCDQVA